MYTHAQTMPYRLNEQTGLIDYDMLEKTATLFRPKIIVAGAASNTQQSSSCIVLGTRELCC